jgi:hypothetical protein
LADDAKSKITDGEVKDRLDTLFDESDTPFEMRTGTAAANRDDPLEDLRNSVMSIEWEITDDVMARFVEQIEALKDKYGKDRILVMFLQLLGSLGLYVRTYKAKAHPNSFKLIHSVYSGFDRVMSTEGLSASEKKKLLYVELNKYKELKEQIDQTKAVPKKTQREIIPEAVSHPAEPPAEEKIIEAEELRIAKTTEPASHEVELTTTVARLIEQLKTFIEKELAGIRSEIRALKKNS